MSDNVQYLSIKQLRLHNVTIEALNCHRRKGEQKVIVQHVNVENGGKVIVGNLITGEGKNKMSEVLHVR